MLEKYYTNNNNNEWCSPFILFLAIPVGPNQISVEVWKVFGEGGLKWLTELFTVIFRTTKMP